MQQTAQDAIALGKTWQKILYGIRGAAQCSDVQMLVESDSSAAIQLMAGSTRRGFC